MRRGLATCAGTVLLLLAGAPESLLAQDAWDPAETAGLSGDWVLNTLLSDDPAEQIPRAAVPPGARNREPQRPPSGTAQLRQAMERFSITQTDSTIVIGYPDRDLVLHPDGNKRKDVVSEDLQIEYRAWGDGSTLVVDRKRDDGLTLTERYSILESTGRLHILTRLHGDRLPQVIAFVRVYDPASD